MLERPMLVRPVNKQIGHPMKASADEIRTDLRQRSKQLCELMTTQPIEEQIRPREMPWVYLSALRCPGCGKEGTPVGDMFRTPAQNDRKGW
ncbi:hypothetical protein NEOLEDRAFT_1135119 [Neolentinus lepideus HHB14362 ss-1]|uniref:Uncharacterized protein n=1 Tax=Neolentinus lepideus HHB14362 ss-1 TaxID=1314782 RepID=A0A165RVP5_9AGAM|nr:hypothetical protein NEOLEDRAFT_1135119 [Neolentinus lepideus HHB14362 ss-1]